MQLKQRTLVILTPGFPKCESDTTCIPDRQIFVRILKKNFPLINIVVLAFQYPFEAKNAKWHGMDVICFNGRNKGKLSRLFTWYHVWKALRELNRKYELIGLLSFWIGECSFIGKLFARSCLLPHYCWILGQDAKKGNKYVKFIRPENNQLIALSDSLAAEFYKNYDVMPGHVIPNGIAPSLYPFKNFPRDIDVLGAGSLIPLKQYDIFLSMVSEIKGHFPSVKAIIAGKGPEAKKLSELAESMGLEKNVLLAGERPHEELLLLMQRSRVFLHTSLYEGFSSVCLEALYGGAQVVSFCQPMNIHLEHWHVVNDQEEMLQKALDILNDPFVDHSPRIPYVMDENAKRLMALYD